MPAKDNTLTRTIFTMQWFPESGATLLRAAQSGDRDLMKLLLNMALIQRFRPTLGIQL
jgi:hypothetical protein